jgi:hypothetical protein
MVNKVLTVNLDTSETERGGGGRGELRKKGKREGYKTN